MLRTGEVVFPRVDAAHLLAIKTGTLPYREVAAEIDALLPQIEAEAEASALPDAPDVAWIEDFVMDAHRAVTCA